MRNILNYYADTDSHWILYFHISIVMQGATKKYFPCILSQEWKQRKFSFIPLQIMLKQMIFGDIKI